MKMFAAGNRPSLAGRPRRWRRLQWPLAFTPLAFTLLVCALAGCGALSAAGGLAGTFQPKRFVGEGHADEERPGERQWIIQPGGVPGGHWQCERRWHAGARLRAHHHAATGHRPGERAGADPALRSFTVEAGRCTGHRAECAGAGPRRLSGYCARRLYLGYSFAVKRNGDDRLHGHQFVYPAGRLHPICPPRDLYDLGAMRPVSDCSSPFSRGVASLLPWPSPSHSPRSVSTSRRPSSV